MMPPEWCSKLWRNSRSVIDDSRGIIYDHIVINYYHNHVYSTGHCIYDLDSLISNRNYVYSTGHRLLPQAKICEQGWNFNGRTVIVYSNLFQESKI